jgi:hypothetical protein
MSHIFELAKYKKKIKDQVSQIKQDNIVKAELCRSYLKLIENKNRKSSEI